MYQSVIQRPITLHLLSSPRLIVTTSSLNEKNACLNLAWIGLGIRRYSTNTVLLLLRLGQDNSLLNHLLRRAKFGFAWQ
jgi:hypothetical protein